MLERVRAKLAGLRRHFSCFALRRILRAQNANATDKPRLQAALVTSIRALGSAFKFDSRILGMEYDDAVPILLRLYEKGLRAQTDAPASGGDHTWFDNRKVWAKLLDVLFLEKVFLGRVAPFIILPPLVRV